MTQFNMHEAKTRLSELVQMAENGEEVIIARNGRAAVKLVEVKPEIAEGDKAEPKLRGAWGTWEAEIKQALGKLNLPAELGETVRRVGLPVLDITADDVVAAARLPLIHRDPLDRMLLAQAQNRGLTLVTADRVLLGYHVPVLWAGTTA